MKIYFKNIKYQTFLLMSAIILFCIVIIFEIVLYYANLLVSIPKILEYFQGTLGLYVIVKSAYLILKVDSN